MPERILPLYVFEIKCGREKKDSPVSKCSEKIDRGAEQMCSLTDVLMSGSKC